MLNLLLACGKHMLGTASTKQSARTHPIETRAQSVIIEAKPPKLHETNEMLVLALVVEVLHGSCNTAEHGAFGFEVVVTLSGRLHDAST